MRKREPSCCYKSSRRNQKMGSFQRNEEDDEWLEEMESESPPQNLVGLENENTTVIAQAEAERCQEFCPSVNKCCQLQPQRPSSFLRVTPNKKSRRFFFKFGWPFWQTTARRKSLRMAKKRQVPIEVPCSGVAWPSCQRFDVSCPSDIYTSFGGSRELDSHPESMYIYAESIKGSISSSSVSQDSLLVHLAVQESRTTVRDPRPEIAEMGSSVEALFGSDSSCSGESTRDDADSDSSCVNADWERSFDSDSDSGNSFAEAQWGSASSCSGSAASGYITDEDLESSFSNTEHCDSSIYCSHSEAEHSDTEVDQDEANHCDLAVSHSKVEYHDLPASHYKPRQNLTVGYFETGLCDSPLGLFEASRCDPLVGTFEAGHNSPVGPLVLGFCDSLDGRFEARPSDSAVDYFKARPCDFAVDHLEARSFNSAFGHFEARPCNSPVGHFKARPFDSPVGRLEADYHNSLVILFEAGHCKSHDDHFDARGCGPLVSHFGAVHHDSVFGHFETAHCDLSVGHLEAGHFKSPVGCFDTTLYDPLVSPFKAAPRDSLVGQFNADTYDLYNAVPVSTEALWNSDWKQNNFCQIVNYPELTWRKLHGVVTHPDRYCVAPCFHEMMKETEQDRNQEEVKINKGFLFHPQRFLQAKNSEYREGQEYSMLRHVQNGSYGDVFSVRDKQTGFTCAAKRIPLSSFSWEEVGAWSRLDSPRVLQLYGAVREGLNVMLFMDLKTGSLAQLLKAKGHFSEDLALYYHGQVLQALEHLHSRKVIHLDVKVDNVLLSQDKKECFLCDFGLSEMLDQTGYSTKTFRGNGLRGTESHMSPEVARGDPRSDKADIWSSCCMLLHMLSGHHPWTRYYTHPLCLKIVSEPAPLWEIPPECDPLTRDVISGGLVKEPKKRDSARELLEKSGRALQAVPGSATPHQKELPAFKIQWISGWRDRAAEEDGPEPEDTYEDSDGWTDETGSWMERCREPRNDSTASEDGNDTDVETKRWRARALVEVEEGESDEEVESDLGSLRELGSEGEWEPFRRLQILCGSKWQHGEDDWSETDQEFAASMISLNLNEPNSRVTLACHRSACTSDAEHADKVRVLGCEDSSVCLELSTSLRCSLKDSDLSDDLSSGVFTSYSSLPDEQSFNLDWSVSTNQPPSCSFEGLGVDIWVEDVNGDTFRIRERLKVKLGHVAAGISPQISMRTFTLATVDGKLVSPDTKVFESRMWLLCLPAPDDSTCWTWRIRDGRLETREPDEEQSDTCSTLAL